jgi:hypothetical protein
MIPNTSAIYISLSSLEEVWINSSKPKYTGRNILLLPESMGMLRIGVKFCRRRRIQHGQEYSSVAVNPHTELVVATLL